MIIDVWILGLLAGVFFLLIGSFLGMLVYRYPKMLLKAWQTQCEELRKEYPEPVEANFNLAWPGSFCVHCNHRIAWYDNIPIVGFLCRKGQCRYCARPISWRYPLTELFCLLISALVLLIWGWQWPTLAALVFTWTLLAMSIIDLEYQLIPDACSLGLLWLGLLLNSVHLFIPLPLAIWGAVVGYTSLWFIMMIYQKITGKIGMGHGDFKLFAALGAWFGLPMLLPIILLASVLGSMVGLTLWLGKRIAWQSTLPFGPFLAFAGWVMLLLWQTPVVKVWLS